MSSSRSSSVLSSVLSSPPSPSDDERLPTFTVDAPSSSAASPPAMEPSPPKRKKEPSPPHEPVLADNQDIAFIVMFRSRFSEAFPPKLINFGPQDVERGVVDSLPSDQIESLLCAILALVLNRKKPVEKGHYGRALEEAISTNKSQWPRAWGGVNPLTQNRSFHTMNPQERLILLKWLIMWSLHSSEAINNIMKDSYKQSRHDDDLNQPLSVQPWGRDGDKRRYWLIEGRDDTPFRVYRESNPALKTNTWRSVAGTIEELVALGEKLKNEDGTQAARRLATSINGSIPRFEATEVKRKRREYRMARNAAFTRPDPGFSLYEGRTRGKRLRYTYSDEEEADASELSESMLGTRRSARQSGLATPADPSRPTVTASGRHVRSRMGGLYGESLLSGQSTDTRGSPATENYEHSNASEEPRATRGGRGSNSNGLPKQRKHIEGYNSVDEMDDEDDASSSGGEWDGGDEDEPDIVFAADDSDDDEDSEMSSEDDESEPMSLVVTLRYSKPGSGGTKLPTPSPQVDVPLPSVEEARSAGPQFQFNAKQPAANGYPTAAPTYPPSVAVNGHSNAAPSKPATQEHMILAHTALPTVSVPAAVPIALKSAPFGPPIPQNHFPPQNPPIQPGQPQAAVPQAPTQAAVPPQQPGVSAAQPQQFTASAQQPNQPCSTPVSSGR